MSQPTRHHPDCMGCGAANPTGLGLHEVVYGADRVTAHVTLDERHTGAPGLAHGGALAAIFDDLLGHVPSGLGRPAVTGSLTTTFRQPTPLHRRIDLASWLERESGRKLLIRGEARIDGALVAESEATFLEVGLEHFRRHSNQVDWLVNP